MKNVLIAGTGSYLPEKVLTNRDFEQMVETSDEWIVTRTGIRERRVSNRNEAASDLGAQAAMQACLDASVSLEDIDCLICATITGDLPLPSTACIIQKKLGLKSAPAFDISAACTGFLYGLELARCLIIAGNYKNILVVAAECMTRVTDYQDRNTCVLFGDGAGAAVVSAGESEQNGLIGSFLAADGEHEDLVYIPAGGSRLPASRETVDRRLHFLKMEGSTLFKIAVLSMSEAVRILLKRFKVKPEEVGLIIPHQANLRIINGVAKNLGIPEEKFYVNIQRYGNMSAASVAVALDEAKRERRLKTGDLVVTVAFGGGLTWGANLIRWVR
ncbi:MAG: ketoacyl-ACP synthase III [Candidatus Omnitrophica bacterium]|nr:ketoacyl-ACP synthase III [Candidatus Omnitrophota bacterium]